MKQRALYSTVHKQLLIALKIHLQTLNYSNDTVFNTLRAVKEYLIFIESKNIVLSEITDTTHFFDHLQARTNITTGAGLSVAYLHKYRTALKLFYSYLTIVAKLPAPEFPKLQRAKSQPSVLTISEVDRLFKACDSTLLGRRNKALLALYYGLGLRRKEGINVAIEHLDFQREELLVAKSKTQKQRIVPISDHVKEILEEYVYNVREKLIPESKSTDLLIVTNLGTPLSAESASYLVKKCLQEAKIKTPAGIHTLRHSIATHLLQSGMSLENIALFLGHSSLDSTQIYTHLKAESAQ